MNVRDVVAAGGRRIAVSHALNSADEMEQELTGKDDL